LEIPTEIWLLYPRNSLKNRFDGERLVYPEDPVRSGKLRFCAGAVRKSIFEITITLPPFVVLGAAASSLRAAI
jgi:hypothetical protein